MAEFLKIKQELIDAVSELDEEKVTELTETALRDGTEPLDILEAVNEGMLTVGRLYESKTYFIADLIMAGLIFKEVLGLEQMTELFHARNKNKIGKVVLGTVQGDLHDIGKDIFRGLMETNSFEVIDLGVDIPKEAFIRKVIEHKPDILGMSGVLTYTIDAMKDVVGALDEAGVRDQLKVIAGGNHLTRENCAYIGADAYANDAFDGVKICLEWVKEKKNQGEL
ncbi:MAG: cobalamin-dependent protein [Firmicutes bacterium]|nr:cobalamin-dependent protein [Bacillota bacterium]